MQYRTFDILNFKGISDLHLDLQRPGANRVFTLIGLNESGKTTVLQALRWLYRPDDIAFHDLIPRSLHANFTGTVRVQADLHLDDSDWELLSNYLSTEHHFTTAHQVTALSRIRTATFDSSAYIRTGLQHTCALVGRKHRSQKTSPLAPSDPIYLAAINHLLSRRLPHIVHYPNFLFDFPDRIVLSHAENGSPLEDSADRLAQTYRDALQDVLTSVDSKLKITKHLIERHQSGGREAERAIESTLSQASGSLTRVFRAAWKSILGRELLDTQITFGTRVHNDNDQLYVQLKTIRGDVPYEIREHSLGFRWFLAFVLFTHFRSYRDPEQRPSVFLLDEPAANLHPSAQTELMHALDRLPQRHVVMYSTHSHYMIEPKWFGSAFVVRNAGQSSDGIDARDIAATTDISVTPYFQFVASHPNQPDLYRPALDAVLFRPGPLDKVPEVIITEGKNDFYTLEYLKVCGISGAQHLTAYPVVGRGTVAAVVAQYLAWGREFLVLLDADSGGLSTAGQLNEDFGPILEGRIVTLEEVDAKWHGWVMEDLFDPTDRRKIALTQYPNISGQPSKEKFNLSLQQLVVEHRVVTLQVQTRRRLERLVRHLIKAAPWLGTGSSIQSQDGES